MPPVRSANLCWGQHHHVLRYLAAPAASRHEAHIATSYPLPPGCTTEHVRAALTHLVRRHEGLRTVYDLNAAPWPRQLVRPPAPPPMVEVSVEQDPAAEVRRLTETPFDLAAEGPLRACLITSGDQLRRLHLVFNHLAFDDVALDQLSAELDALLAARVAGRPAALPPVADQPVDLATREAGTHPETALAHWREEIRALPTDIHAARRTATGTAARAAEPAAHSASLTVPGLLAATRAIAANAHVWPAAVHVAGYAVALAAHTGRRRVPHRLYTSQRAASALPSVLTCMSHPLLCALDLTDDPPFSEVLRRAATRVRQAMANGHVPFDRIDELVAAESARRGQSVRVASELNFLDNAPRSCRTGRDRFVWNAAPLDWARAGSDLYLRVYEWSDGVTLALQALDEIADRAAVERFLRGYAALLTAHADPTVDLRVEEAVRLVGLTPPAETATPAPADATPGAAPHPAHPALAAAVAEVNGLDLVDLADSYPAAGGRLLRLPRVLAALADRGWTGTLGDLAAPRPLRAVADTLRPCPPSNSGRTR
ncbi:condensation domain-containing protein [Streptomyces sp. DSM 44915]|uniref:Condensation domain-containing protein n=1 Tax=Streptomyces chisholmiae TaxID=3075540 RepID=A0ABU2JT44_9ACTN|nr:condensation domain-containing protein [Streptomyces sp. DSM 44915]MDT0267368.1 condensation domain-containing protein [Streptomyces sp. DSM 44915]